MGARFSEFFVLMMITFALVLHSVHIYKEWNDFFAYTFSNCEISENIMNEKKDEFLNNKEVIMDKTILNEINNKTKNRLAYLFKTY